MATLRILFASLALALAGTAHAGPQGPMMDFNTLDADQDGHISRTEAEGHRSLTEQWQKLDVDGNDRIEPAEFSAFEPMPMHDGSGMGMKQGTPEK
ncbi:EF-hand domain-containing protein [Thiohalobacter sp.]|uniref:EF-hand domain-containing protein n=1 Tax=Thiohalobacter sp. TaxID=2025948 RepID=UPI00261FA987|nr:EF-hand domain-containing protein [Thiohalobacter sp.]